jgi:EAL domain-containing protein (putative c-di-GMP-specific phosphodiesterase class I)
MMVSPQTTTAALEDFARGLDLVLADPDRIGLAFQPIVDLARGALAGYESLARFRAEPQATPDLWFEAAEALGRGEELEAVVVARALRARSALPPNCFLSINIGPRAICSPPVRDVLDRHGDLAALVIEITEQSPVEDYAVLSDALATAREAGALVAVDDAGAGFASLRHVAELRPDFVKVDRALVANLDLEPVNAAIVEMLGVLAGRLDAWVIAEGVERDAELARLVDLGVPLAQGFGLARPAMTMEPLAPEAVAQVARLSRDRDTAGVGPLCEPCRTVPAQVGDGGIAAAFADDAAIATVALVDELGRPLALLCRDAFAAGRPPVAVSMTVQPISDVSEVARRAMTRPLVNRFDPIACCDEQGRPVGVLRIERLLEALAR